MMLLVSQFFVDQTRNIRSRFFQGLIVCLIAIGSTSVSRGALIISIDFDPLTAGIQNSTSVFQGQSFAANLVLQYNDAVGLDSYRFSVQYDDLGLTALTATNSPPANFIQGLAGPPTIVAPTIGPFNGDSVVPFNGPTIVNPVNIGTINFTASMVLGDFSISPFEDVLFDGSFNNDFDQIKLVTFNSGSVSITAVPEPSSILLLFFVAILMIQQRTRSYSNCFRPGKENMYFCSQEKHV